MPMKTTFVRLIDYEAKSRAKSRLFTFPNKLPLWACLPDRQYRMVEVYRDLSAIDHREYHKRGKWSV